MDARLQRRVQRYGWDAAADKYDSGWAPRLRLAHDRLMELAGLRPGMRVLEVACGTGLVTLRVASIVGSHGAVMATDISEAMVAETARNAAAALSNINTARMEAEALTFPDGSFDAAICALGLMYVPDPRLALSEMRRVVRSGGRVAATVWGERRNCGWAEIFPIVDAVVASDVCPLFFGTGAPGALIADAAAAGLSEIAERRDRVDLHWHDDRSLLTAMIDSGPVALAAKRFTAEVRTQVEKQFLASVAEFRRGDGTYVIPGEFCTVAGTV
jgi:ubiquinone/menaquinone biosynthesis C-methylase UbiE